MKQFEYLVQFYENKRWCDIARELDGLGKDGWELVSVCTDIDGDRDGSTTTGYNCFLKREVKKDKVQTCSDNT